jgi:hypothetical protein
MRKIENSKRNLFWSFEIGVWNLSKYARIPPALLGG